MGLEDIHLWVLGRTAGVRSPGLFDPCSDWTASVGLHIAVLMLLSDCWAVLQHTAHKTQGRKQTCLLWSRGDRLALSEQ